MDDTRNTIYDLVEQNLRRFEGRYPIDVTDQVFLAIEKSPTQLKIYQSLVKARGTHSVNLQIGKMVREITGLNNLGRNKTPRSRLIKSYEKHG